MRETTELWKTLRAANADIEVKWNINGTEYYANSEVSHRIEHTLFDDVSIGNASTAKLTLHIIALDIPRASKIQRYIRLTSGDSATDWVKAGTFWVNRRSSDDDDWTLEAYDAMRKADAPFLGEGDTGTWPRTTRNVIEEICARIGVTLDERTNLKNYSIEYPNDLTMREMLGHIAAAHGGNFIITHDETLYLVPLLPNGTADDIGDDLASCFDNGKREAISRVTLWYDDDNYYTAGTDTGLTLEADIPWATKTIANAVLAAVNGYAYQAYSAAKANIDPAHELGDPLTVNGLASVLAQIDDDGGGFPDIAAPGKLEDADEYPVEGPLQRALNRTVKLGQSYYGTTIDRESGLTVQKVNALGGLDTRAVINSDTLAFYDEDGEPVLYFDPSTGKYKFVGDVTVQEGSININDKFVVDEDGNVEMSGEASIFGGKYYAGSPEDEQGYSEMTSTGFSVVNALGQVKLVFGYVSSNFDYPFVELGSGDGASGTKGLLKKFQDGLWIGNDAPKSATGMFSPQSGYIGIFFKFSDNKAYVVSGTNMLNLYTGDTVARFG